jgi:hypothetical protein
MQMSGSCNALDRTQRKAHSINISMLHVVLLWQCTPIQHKTYTTWQEPPGKNTAASDISFLIPGQQQLYSGAACTVTVAEARQHMQKLTGLH